MSVFRALTTAVAVTLDDDLPLVEIARALIRAYPPSEHAKLNYQVKRDAVLRDGVPLLLEDVRDVVPLFEMDLYEQAVARAAPGWILHAAALEVAGKALVLSGPSGAGKTTLTLALVARGFRLLSEEVVWISSDARVRGLARPIHVSGESPQRAHVPGDWQQLSYPIRGRDGVMRDHALLLPPTCMYQTNELPLAAIVRIGHGPDWPVYLEESGHRVALERLWDRSLRQDDSGLEAATAVLRGHITYELSSRAIDEALALLDPLLK